MLSNLPIKKISLGWSLEMPATLSFVMVGIRGFVILCDKLNNVSVDGYTIEAEAGANLIETTRIALRHSLTGFEFACGIPGSVGGAVFHECRCLWW